MTHIEVKRNDLPTLLANLPSIIEERTVAAMDAARGAAQKGVDEPEQPSSDTGALREGMVIQTVDGDDYAERKEAAMQAFTGHPSRFDKSGRMHTEERFNQLCADRLEPMPSADADTVVVMLCVLMAYGAWWESGDAYDLRKGAKRPSRPWFAPSILSWAVSDLTGHYEGIFKEALGR